ncbi:hypothetical protein P692DRAFT_20726750 [Suillus brevipes Sb2]|nr:hypothetical protein P692DRAFT_20726750 [Suillus brevipes Sb2]
MPSILTNLELETDPNVSYPPINDFLAKLDKGEPRRGWIEKFLRPLTSLGVRTLDDIEIISPECLIVFHRLCPLMVMDFFVHIINYLDEASNLAHQSSRL